MLLSSGVGRLHTQFNSNWSDDGKLYGDAENEKASGNPKPFVHLVAMLSSEGSKSPCRKCR